MSGAATVSRSQMWRSQLRPRSIRATPEERARQMPGDEYIPSPLATLTHALTVHCDPPALWPWLVQMGAGRAGWYSYDWVDNGRRPSASRVVPELQHVEIGQIFPALPGTKDGFVVLAFEPLRTLVLGWSTPEGVPVVTWAFMLERVDRWTTRLIVRARGSRAYRFRGLPPWASTRIAPAIHFIMQRKQLLGLARRAEGPSNGLLDRFVPVYDVVERHHIRVNAPAEVTLAAARDMDIMGTPLARAIFRARELALRAKPVDRVPPRGILDATLAIGWVVLDEIPGREVAVGAVTRPWEANVTFRSIPPDMFAAFAEPGYVKIVWTLRADPIDASTSTFRTETRAVATDAVARRRFRLYWWFVSPGISLIRWLALRPLRKEAERRAQLLLAAQTTGGRRAQT